MRVLVACEFSGTVRDAFIRRGHDAYSCDLIPSEVPGPHIIADCSTLLDRGWDLMIAHPPCTYLCSSGARYWKLRRDRQLKAIAFVNLLYHARIPRICIENPIGILSTDWQPPTQIIQPFHFGAPVRKATCLWLRNLPPLPIPDMPYSYFPSMTMGEIKNRSKIRSRTFPQVAAAMAYYWSQS